MRRAVTLGLVWLIAAGVAAVIAWQGVAVVGEQVTDDRPAPLRASEVAAALAETTTTTAAVETPADAPGASTTLAGGTPATGVTTPAATPATTASNPGPNPAPTTAPPAATVPAPSAAAETRTYNLVGGSTAMRFEAGSVTVLWATPNAGFTVDIGSEGSGVRVEFESEEHRSRVDGWWDGGPRDEVRED